jgi:phenylalanyl-tRNA synthetase beta chain
MRISFNWLKQLVDFDLAPEPLAEALTMAGFEVESIEDRRTWADGVVVGKILQAERHPNADKLQVCQVAVGKAEPLQIVCGAANARTGLYVTVATVGTYLPAIDLKLRPTKLRGEKSEGMICSLSELGLEKESPGIFEFDGEPEPGADVRPLLGLDDVVLDVTSTANRADALSMVGIAREVSAITGGKLNLAIAPTSIPNLKANWLKIIETKACPAYCGTLIRGVKIADSPQWLQRCLQAAGMRPINNLVDITNYVLLEWGQPLHAFDADTLGDLNIGVRFANANESLITLDSNSRQLSTQNLVITSQNIPVAIAGVMGGKASEVNEKTENILLEAALFDRATIRKSARAQGLRTEASARYERGVNQAGLEIAYNRAIQLILEIAGGIVSEQAIADTRISHERKIELSLERVCQVLGEVELADSSSAFLTAKEVEQTLKSLSFELRIIDQDLDNLSENIPNDFKWEVLVPSFRHSDIEREIDLIEEIARIFGYHRFIETLPERTELGYLSVDIYILRQVREALRGLGLTEVLHNSLCSPTGASQVIISNPVAIEYSAMRTDLLSGLIDACSFNLNQGNGCLQAFEVGRVFQCDEDGSLEVDRIAGIFGGDPTVGIWQHLSSPIDWYEAKGTLENLFQRFEIEVEYQPDRSDDRLHPGRTASLWIAGERLGTFGQLHPRLCAERELPDLLYGFELDLYQLMQAIDRRSIPIFKSFSNYPSSDRDLAFFALIKVSVAELQRSILHTGGELLESVTLFDRYLGEGVPEGSRSLAFRLVYRGSDRTLTDTDIQPVHQQIREVLEEKFRVVLRS